MRAALVMLYDKWEYGEPCYEEPDSMECYIGHAFKLSEAEENQVLTLIPKERNAVDTKARQSGESTEVPSHAELVAIREIDSR